MILAVLSLLADLAIGIAVAGPPAPAPIGATIEGHVTRAGASVADAKVEVRRLFDLDANMDGYAYRALFQRLLGGPDAWAPVATTTSDASGRFAATDLAPGVYDAEVVASDGAFGFSSVTLPVAGARVEAPIELPRATRPFRGRIVTADGHPFTGSLLCSTEAATSEFMGMTTRGVWTPIEKDGRFSIAGVNAGTLRVVAVERGQRATWSERIEPSDDGRFVLVVDEGFESLRVRVMDATTSAPIPDAVVVGKGPTSGDGSAMVRATTDANGECTLRTVGSTRGEIWAYHPGYQEIGVHGVGGSRGPDVVVKLERAARLEGRVVRDDDGKPLEGLDVRAVPTYDQKDRWPFGHARTDADGRFTIDGAQAGDATVFAEGLGWVTKDLSRGIAFRKHAPYRCTLAAGKTASVELRVVPAAILGGSVVDRDGKPVAGVVLRVQTFPDDPRGEQSFADFEQTRAITATRADGRFAFDRIHPADPASLRVSAVGVPVQFVNDVALSASAPAGVEVRLVGARTLDIAVLDDATGKPIAAAEIDVETIGDPNGRSDFGWRGETDADGHARAGPVAAAPLRVRAVTAGYVRARVRVENTASTAPTTIRLSRPATLSGHVFMPDGTPATDANLRFDTEADAPCDTSGQTQTDCEGAFRFDDAPPCDVTLLARAYPRDRGFAEAKIVARGGANDVRLTLVPNDAAKWEAGAPSLVVHVVDADGKPLETAWIDVEAPTGVHTTALVKNGRGEVSALPRDAPLSLEVSVIRDWLKGRPPFAPAHVVLAPGTRETTVRLVAGRTIEGHVVDATGKPIPAASVAAVPPSELPRLLHATSGQDWATCSADGAFRVEGLGEGIVVVVVDGGAAWIAREMPSVVAGARDVVVTLQPSTSASIRVLRAKGDPVDGAYVSYRSATPRIRETVDGRTGRDGVFVLTGLDAADSGTLTVDGDQGFARLSPWRPHDETVRVAPRPPTDASTDVVVHPDAPIVAGHNVLWCATSQLAWDALADAIERALPGVAPDGRLPLLAPAPPDLVERLNRRSFPHAAIDPAATVVIGGLARDGVGDKIRDAWRTTFGPDDLPPQLSIGPTDAVGVAGFRKDLPFDQPFTMHPEAISFAGGAPIVRAWGIRSYETGPGAVAAAKQLTTYLPPEWKGLPSARRPAIVVEIRPKDPSERIVLAELEPKATLEATWAAVAVMLKTWTPDTVDPGSRMVVPTIRLDADQRFSAFEGAPIKNVVDSELRSFQERVRFRLSERGASLGAESTIVCSFGIHPELVFDRPFLVALRRASEIEPYFLLWVGNDALLERFAVPKVEPIDAETLKPLVGRWELDVEPSRDATTLREYALGIEPLKTLGFAPDAKPSPAEILARHKAKYPRHAAEEWWNVTIEVLPDGSVVLQRELHEIGPSDERIKGVIDRIDGALSLRLTDSANPDRPGPVEYRESIALRDGRIEIVSENFVWILKRR
jgi:hypothetical protein